MEHTKTPWTIIKCPCGQKGCNSFMIKEVHMCDSRMTKEDAAFIVRAVNAHDDNITHLKNILFHADGQCHCKERGVNCLDAIALFAKQALAKAEAV